MKHYIVTAAILKNNNKYLAMQRGRSKYDYISNKFEFPGGKVEKGETFVQALKRELIEELKIVVDVLENQFFYTVEHEYTDFKITMHSYICEVNSREIELTEHIDYRWLKRDELMTLDWAAADVPIVEKLMKI